MSRKIARGCTILGLLLLLAAILLVLMNLHQDEQGKESSAQILAAFREEIAAVPAIPAQIPAPILPAEDLLAEYVSDTDPAPETEPIIVLCEGRECIGILSIPVLGLELPVLAEESATNFKLAPCRYSGTAAGGDLIVAAHNYRSHFGTLSALAADDQIIFTDALGQSYVYAVQQTEILDGYAVRQMHAGAAEEWDLTLFTCTLGGKSRVTVRASMEE